MPGILLTLLVAAALAFSADTTAPSAPKKGKGGKGKRAATPPAEGSSAANATPPQPTKAPARQTAVVETLLPLESIGGADEGKDKGKSAGDVMYEFMPSAESILEEVVPASFRAKLFKCFLDAAVSEQIARMVAMKSATENASDMIKQLSSEYNRARQSQITGEIMEIIGGAESLKS